MTTPFYSSIAETLRFYAQKKISPVEVARAHIERVQALQPRLNAYEKQTAPLVSYYRRLGALHQIDASKSVAEVEQEITQAVANIRGAR